MSLSCLSYAGILLRTYRAAIQTLTANFRSPGALLRVRLAKIQNPLLPPLLAFAAGIAVAKFVGFGVTEIAAVTGLFALFAVLAARRSAWLLWTCWLLAWLAGGGLVDTLHKPGPPPRIDAGPDEIVLLDGCVVEPPVFFEDRDQFTLELAPGARAHVSLALGDGEKPPDLRYGQRIEIEAKVRRLRNFRNPGAFDYITYSARRDVYWSASMRRGSQVKFLPGRCGSRFFAAVFTLRSAALARIESLYPNDPYATGMMEATLIGESGKLQKIWTEDFRRTGTYHALVISGLHVSVLAGVLLFCLRLLFLPELPSLTVTALAAWLYTFVSGWNPPAIRAAAGFTLYLLARYFFRRTRLMNLLSVIGLIYLLYDPSQLFDASFQLSFLAVAAIGVLAIPLLDATSTPFARGLRDLSETGRDPRLPPGVAQFRIELRLLSETVSLWLRLPVRACLFTFGLISRAALYAWEMFVISAVIQIGLALPMAIYFHRISFSGLSANMIIVPLMSLVVPFGFAAIFTGWSWLARIAGFLLVASRQVAAWHVRWEPNWRVPDPPLWLSIAFVAALIGLSFALSRRWWRWPASAAVLALFTLIFWHPFRPQVDRGILELTAIDVGQGDSLLVAFPNGRLMLVDGGGIPVYGSTASARKAKSKLDIGEDVVSPYLWSRSIGHIDVIACTHAHEDHAGGLAALIDNFHPAELWAGANPDSEIWRNLREHARRNGTRIVNLHDGDRRTFGQVRIDVLAPAPDYVPGDVPKNNDSLVMRLRYGSRSLLLTGDVEKQIEERMLDEREIGHADILKVAHHGSKTSTTEPFLDAVQPEFAIISDGVDNPFHHPNPDVVTRLEEHHADVLRTDQLGLITVRTDGRRIWADTDVWESERR